MAEDKKLLKELADDLDSCGFIKLIKHEKRDKSRYILHIGPTNSGKTYNALQALRKSSHGVYLGPLRLLALEVFDTLNKDGVYCSLKTGEEYYEVPFSTVTASTVEMLDMRRHYDVAVIDEAQCISDNQRGGHWALAVLGIDADEIHICMSPEAENLIRKLLEKHGSKYKVCRYKRLVPLEYKGLLDSIQEIKPGDALITFSRTKVLRLAADLEYQGIKTSVIYGNLPPAARREEIKRFISGESQVIVATDAIGMGVSLPIRRIIFCETCKYDGSEKRNLRPSEIKQIAGRAGRYGKYDVGEVLTMSDPALIRNALNSKIPDLKKITLPFPRDVIEKSHPLIDYMQCWNNRKPAGLYKYEDMTRAQVLLTKLKDKYGHFSVDTLYHLITCPFDYDDKRLVWYWHICCDCIDKGQELPMPDFGQDTLEGCELQYNALDLAYRLKETAEEGKLIQNKKIELCDDLCSFLLNDKAKYLSRCRQCGKRLPFNSKSDLCDSCQKQNIRYFPLYSTLENQYDYDEKKKLKDTLFLNFTRDLRISLNKDIQAENGISKEDAVIAGAYIKNMVLQKAGDWLIFCGAINLLKAFSVQEDYSFRLMVGDRMEYLLSALSYLDSAEVLIDLQNRDGKADLIVQVGRLQFVFDSVSQDVIELAKEVPDKYKSRLNISDIDMRKNASLIFYKSITNELEVSEVTLKGNPLKNKIQRTLDLYSSGQILFGDVFN